LKLIEVRDPTFWDSVHWQYLFIASFVLYKAYAFFTSGGAPKSAVRHMRN
jgi:hypothetical protein